MAKILENATRAIGIASTIKSFLDIQEPSELAGGAGRFRAHIGKTGLAPTNRFILTINIPSKLGAFTNNVKSEEVSMMCSSANLPGITLNTVPFKPYGIGMNRNIVTGGVVNTLTTNVYCDADGVMQGFFYEWINRIYGFSSTPQNDQSYGDSSNRYPNCVEFFSNYVVDIKLVMFNELDQDILTCTMLDCFPTSFGEVSLSWDNQNQIAMLPVTFSYVNWRFEPLGYGADAVPSSKDSRGLSGLQSVVKGLTVLQTLGMIKKPRSVQDAIGIANNAKVLLQAFKFN